MIGFDELAREIGNVGLTLICFVVGVIIINWLDRNVFSGHKNFKKDRDND